MKFNLFRKRSSDINDPKKANHPEFFTELIASDNGTGVITLTMRDPDTRTFAIFPAIDLLLRSSEDMERRVDELRSMGVDNADLPVVEPLVDGVVATFGIEQRDSYTLLSDSMLRNERLRPAMARTGALTRLRQASQYLKLEGGAGRLRVKYEENLDLTASFLLVADEWLASDKFDGEPVFAIGTRVSIHVCGSGDAESLAGLAQIAETIYHDSVQDPVNNGRPVTPRLLTIRDGELAFFEA